MARKQPFFRPQIDQGIQEKLKKIKVEQRYHGSLASFVESVLDKYADGLLVDVKEGAGQPLRAEFEGFEEKKHSRNEKQRYKRAS